jgi:hypothetical protein
VEPKGKGKGKGKGKTALEYLSDNDKDEADVFLEDLGTRYVSRCARLFYLGLIPSKREIAPA